MNKRSFTVIISVFVVLMSVIFSFALGETPIRVFFDNVEIAFDQPPVIINGRTLVPMRAIFEAIGADVEWDEEEQTITVTSADKSGEVGNNVEITLNQQLVAQAIELTRRMGHLAGNEAYVSATIGHSAEASELITMLAGGRYENPGRTAVMPLFADESQLIFDVMLPGVAMSDESYDEILRRLLASIIPQMNAMQGVNYIVAQSVTSVSMPFLAHKDFTDYTYVILAYDDIYSVVIFDKPTSEGITAAQGTFLFPNDYIVEAMETDSLAEFFTNYWSFYNDAVESTEDAPAEPRLTPAEPR